MIVSLSKDQFSRVARGFHSRPGKSSSLNKLCYTQSDFLQVERQEIFQRSWQFVCHEEKLRDIGCYVTAEIEGQSVFVTRTESGELKAFYNVCKHRAHELLSGEGQTRLIMCPYHAWTYKLDGSLFKVRRSEYIEDFDQKEICLTGIQLETFCNLIFVNLDSEAKSLASQTGNLAQEINAFAPDIGELTFSKRLTYTVQANWKAVVDNFLECYHCPIAHRDFCSLIDMDTYQVKTHGIYSSHMAKATTGDANNAYSVDDASVTDHAVWFLWPNITLMRYPGRGNFMVWRFYPINELTTYEVFDFFFESVDMNESEREAIKFIDEVLQPEDIGLVESVQRGMRTPAFEEGRFMVDPAGSGMSEHAVHHFHGLVLDAYRRVIQS